MAKRIQRRRTKGWKMPPNTVSVTRPGKYGNPFIVSEKLKPGRSVNVVYFAVPTVEDSIECFREYAAERLAADPHWLDELRGRDVACFCGLDKPCHGDVLLELANKEPTPTKGQDRMTSDPTTPDRDRSLRRQLRNRQCLLPGVRPARKARHGVGYGA